MCFVASKIVLLLWECGRKSVFYRFEESEENEESVLRQAQQPSG